MREFVMEDGEKATPYYRDYKNFIKPYFKTKYIKDTLIVTTLKQVNSCGETIGDIKISNDTIYLLSRNISDEECASVVFHKFTYYIHNPGNKKYKIKNEL